MSDSPDIYHATYLEPNVPLTSPYPIAERCHHCGQQWVLHRSFLMDILPETMERETATQECVRTSTGDEYVYAEVGDADPRAIVVAINGGEITSRWIPCQADMWPHPELRKSPAWLWVCKPYAVLDGCDADYLRELE